MTKQLITITLEAPSEASNKSLPPCLVHIQPSQITLRPVFLILISAILHQTIPGGQFLLALLDQSHDSTGDSVKVSSEATAYTIPASTTGNYNGVHIDKGPPSYVSLSSNIYIPPFIKHNCIFDNLIY